MDQEFEPPAKQGKQKQCKNENTTFAGKFLRFDKYHTPLFLRLPRVKNGNFFVKLQPVAENNHTICRRMFLGNFFSFVI